MNYEQAMEHCLFRFVSGSKAYGTDRAESDEDHRGVFVSPLVNAFELFQTSFVASGPLNERLSSAMAAIDRGEAHVAREHVRHALIVDNGDLITSNGTVHRPGTDEELQELRKFLKLAAENNPNIIEFLYVDRLISHETDAWRRIRAKREMFLSKKARYTFAGYAIAQLNRIKTHRGYLMDPPKGKPNRKDFGLPDETVIAKDFHHAAMTLPVHFIQPQFQEVVRQERAYNDVLDHWKSYESWKKQRNEKRADLESKYGYDTKHAMHLVRLIRMGKEILTEGVVKVYRPDRDELKAIRDGAWSYDKVVDYAENVDAELNELYEKSTLRHAPDHKGISELYKEVCEEAYGIKLK